jgi:hypothetical protein
MPKQHRKGKEGTMIYVSNAFSLGMVPRGLLPTVRMAPCEQPDTKHMVSVVGHPDTAAMLGVAFNRATLRLSAGDVLYVAQYLGPRLPEGTVTLPEGARFEWIEVRL